MHKILLNPNFTQIFAFLSLLCQNIIINSVRVCQYFLFIITPRPKTLKESEKKGREWNIKIIYYRTLTFITTLETQLASLMYTLCLFSPLLWRCLASFIFFFSVAVMNEKCGEIKNTSTKRGFICWNYHIPWPDVSRCLLCMNISVFVRRRLSTSTPNEWGMLLVIVLHLNTPFTCPPSLSLCFVRIVQRFLQPLAALFLFGVITL